MNPESKSPSTEEIRFLNSRGFSQMRENSWNFFKLGYVFDFSSSDLSKVEEIWNNKFSSGICTSLPVYMFNLEKNNQDFWYD